MQILNTKSAVIYECNDCSTMRQLVEKAVKEGVRLSDTDLSGINLSGANLRGANLSRANLEYSQLSSANLSGALLTGADLHRADLSGANLNGVFNMANFSNSNLNGANLFEANLFRANLKGAYLIGANLAGANLLRADFSDADLTRANLSGANLSDADLSGANLYFPMECPKEGEFIGWKKAWSGDIIKLLIPADARRSSATTNKCRCDKAKVLEISSGRKVAISKHDPTFVYRLGEEVSEPNFDPNRWNECAPGIHFFMTEQEARKY